MGFIEEGAPKKIENVFFILYSKNGTLITFQMYTQETFNINNKDCKKGRRIRIHKANFHHWKNRT